MSLTGTLPAQLEHALGHPDLGVLGLVDQLLLAALQRRVRLEWSGGMCRVALLGDSASDRIEVKLPKAVFRAILARIAALCNERTPDSVSPYGGQGEVNIEAVPEATIRVTFSNTPETQRLDLSGIAVQPRAAGVVDYLPPGNVDELLRRYAQGERRFPDMDLSGVDLSGATLEGSVFDGSWISDANFDHANLMRASFRLCNVKCANFRRADLRGASFELASVEGTDFDGALLDGTNFEGAGYYGITIRGGMGFPNGDN